MSEPGDPDPSALARLGYARTPELVGELLAPARRGRDLAVLAGDGSGKEILYALTAAHRCDAGSTDLQALVLAPTRESAARAARAAYELAGPAGLHVLAWSPETSRTDPDAPSPPVAQFVSGRPSSLLSEVQAGRLGLDALRLLVVDGLRDLDEAGESAPVEDLLDTLDEEVQTVVVADRRTGELDRIVERQLTRPYLWPQELHQEGREVEPQGPPLRWTAAPGEEDRLDALSAALSRAVTEEDTEVLVHCTDEGAAHRAAASLSARGFHIATEPGEAGVGVAWGEDEGPEGSVGAWLGLPSGLPGLRRTLGEARHRIAVVRPREIAQLRILARRAGWEMEALGGVPDADVSAGVSRYRQAVARRAATVDMGPELLLLEPVLDSHGLPAVAAALSRWVRELEAGAGQPTRSPATERPREEPSPVQAGGRTSAAREERGRAGGPERKRGPERRREGRDAGARRGGAAAAAPWTRLWVPVGRRDEVRPADLVGAITGETDAAGGQIGKIEIRESYSLVEVESNIADRVIEQLGGATIRGREVEVRRDRHQ